MYISTQERLKGIPGDVYRRKSQEDKRRQVLSLETQRDICDELVGYWDMDVQENHEESKSAKIAGQRREFERMMKRIEKGKVQAIICWKIDRLARNMKEGGWIIDLLQSGKLKAIVTKDKVYLPEDNTIITALELASATEYSRELVNKVHDGNSKKLRGGIPNGYAILGYLNNTHKPQGERDWRDDPDRWEHLQQALRKILDDNLTPSQAFKWLREEIKMTTPKRKFIGGKPLSKSSFYRFISRTEIAGFYYHKGEKIRINDCITPMISEEEYWLIQSRLGKKGNRRITQNLATFSHYVRSPEGYYCTPVRVNRVTCDCKKKFSIKNNTLCKHCGLDVSQMKNPIFYSRTYYYNSHRIKKTMKTKGVPEEKLDAIILDIADRIEMDENIVKWSQKYIDDISGEEIKNWKTLLEKQEERIKNMENRRRKVRDAFLDGTFSKEEYKNEMRIIDMQIAEKRTRNRKDGDWETCLRSLVHLGSEINCVWKNNNIQEKRAILLKLGLNLTWDEENLNVHKPIWLDILINGLNGVKSKNGGIEPKNHPIKKGGLDGVGERCPPLCRMWDGIKTQIIKEKHHVSEPLESG